MVVARGKGGEIVLEAGVLIDGLAADGGWNARVAGASGKTYMKTGLTYVVEAEFDGDAEAAFSSLDDVSESDAEAGRDLSELDAAGAAERVGEAADVVLAVQGDGAAGWDDRCRKDAVVIGEDDMRAQMEASVEREPVE